MLKFGYIPETAKKRPLLSPFNIVTGIIIAWGLVVTFIRFTQGLGSVTNLDQNNPWGLWIGFDLLTGVALAAGGYTTAAAVEIFGMKKYHAAIRPALLTGFLGYFFVGVTISYDVGRPWRLPYPFVVSQGVTSVMFEVGACVALYLTVLFLEFVPAPMEWLGLKKLRKILVRLTLLLTIFGVLLSTLHQSSLGALFLIAPSKLHPLWYSPVMPVFFFVSSICAGLSMVIFEGSLSHKAFHDMMDDHHRKTFDPLTLGYARASSMVLAGYFAIKIFGLALGNNWNLLFTPYGWWYQLEMLGFVLLPSIVFAIGAREKKIGLIRCTAAWTVLGIILNRLNVSVICFNWHLPLEQRYFPSWMEVSISVFIVTMIIVIFRFIVTRMPIFYAHPDYEDAH